MRHGGRPSLPQRGTLRCLTDLGLREESYVTRDLRHRTSYDAECASDLSNAITLSMPGQIRNWKL